MNVFSAWANGIEFERNFWANWVATRGDQWPDSFKRCIDPNTIFDPMLSHLLPISDGAKPKQHFSVLDVGTGPIFPLGYVIPGAELSLFAADPLAPVYDKILVENGITPPVRTQFGTAEDLSAFFPESSFDLVHCSNALDHSFDPMRGILEMLRCAKVGGGVKLMHAPNEAVTQNYVGFHQFNFELVDGKLTLWNNNGRIIVDDEIPVKHTITNIFENGYIHTHIVKLSEFVDRHDTARRDERIAFLCRNIIGALAAF